MMINKTIDIIGVQMDLGAVRKGVDMGPSAIRHAGLIKKIESLGYKVIDRGDVVPAVAHDERSPKMRYSKEINDAICTCYYLRKCRYGIYNAKWREGYPDRLSKGLNGFNLLSGQMSI